MKRAVSQIWFIIYFSWQLPGVEFLPINIFYVYIIFPFSAFLLVLYQWFWSAHISFLLYSVSEPREENSIFTLKMNYICIFFLSFKFFIMFRLFCWTNSLLGAKLVLFIPRVVCFHLNRKCKLDWCEIWTRLKHIESPYLDLNKAG